MRYKATDEWRNNYKTTLNQYEALVGCSPDPRFWESPELRFQSRCESLRKLLVEGEDEENISNYRININLFRLAMSVSLKKEDPSCLNLNTVKQPTHQQFADSPKEIRSIMNNVKKAREEYADSNSFYGWRVNFCHCKNVYSDYDVSPQEGDLVIFNPYDDIS